MFPSRLIKKSAFTISASAYIDQFKQLTIMMPGVTENVNLVSVERSTVHEKLNYLKWVRKSCNIADIPGFLSILINFWWK